MSSSLWRRPEAHGNRDYLQDVQEELTKIPPEERHNAIYYFVKGLFNKQLGDQEQALHNIKHAVSMQPNFLIAKRELRLIELQEKNKPVDLLNADLKDVVGLLFKRKK